MSAVRSLLQICKFYPPSRGGIERVVQIYAEGAAANHWRSEVLCFHDAHAPAPATERIHRLKSFARIGSMPLSLHLAGEIAKRAKAFDIVHLHEPFPTATLASRAIPAANTILLSWHADLERLGPIKYGWDRVQARLCARAHAIIVADETLIAGSRVLPRFAEKCHIAPLGLDLTPFLAAPDPAAIAAIKARFGGAPFVLALGRLTPYKGFDVFIRALAQTQLNAALIGDGALMPALKRQAAQAGLNQRLIFAGAVEDRDLPAWFAAAEMFVLPSISPAEAFGLVQVEAMAAGKPVINTALKTAVPRVSLHGQTGLTVPPGDAEALARAMETLMAQPELRAELGAAGRARAIAHFSKAAAVERLLAIYSLADAARRKSG